LNKFISKASTFPEFSPALGHTYPSLDTSKPKFSDLTQRSKEPTPMPDTQTTSKSQGATTQTDEQISNQLLADTINISLRYGDEYMDEAPVTGQPGDFHLSLKARKEPEKGKLAVPSVNNKASGVNTPEPPTPSKTDMPTLSRKGSKVEKSIGGAPKPKRRKSKGTLVTSGAVTPTS
jgi:mediator of RNA polymerase II transcription subunit 6